MTFAKPTIALRKENETEFVNVRTYWSLSLDTPDRTIELQVKHAAPEDEFKVIEWTEGDQTRLVTQEEFDARVQAIVDNEHVDPTEAADWIESGGNTAPFAQSMAWRVITERDVDRIAHLRRTWDAFELLFNPAINSF
jgi:hypothetical protein